MLGMSAMVSVVGTSSVIWLVANVIGVDDGARGYEVRFTHDGTFVGPVVQVWHNSADEINGLHGFMFKLEGLAAGSHTFALEWRTLVGLATALDTTRNRTLQILEMT